MSDNTESDVHTHKDDSNDTDTDERVERDCDFFAWPHFSCVIFSVLFQNFVLTAAFAPTTFPEVLGPVATFGTYAGLNHPHICLGFAIVLFVGHVYEAYESWKICRKLQLSGSATRKWIFSTLLFGIFSLSQLRSLLKEKQA